MHSLKLNLPLRINPLIMSILCQRIDRNCPKLHDVELKNLRPFADIQCKAVDMLSLINNQ